MNSHDPARSLLDALSHIGRIRTTRRCEHRRAEDEHARLEGPPVETRRSTRDGRRTRKMTKKIARMMIWRRKVFHLGAAAAWRAAPGLDRQVRNERPEEREVVVARRYRRAYQVSDLRHAAQAPLQRGGVTMVVAITMTTIAEKRRGVDDALAMDRSGRARCSRRSGRPSPRGIIPMPTVRRSTPFPISAERAEPACRGSPRRVNAPARPKTPGSAERPQIGPHAPSGRRRPAPGTTRSGGSAPPAGVHRGRRSPGSGPARG